MEKKELSSGGISLSGYIYQSLYAIIVSMKDDKWDRIKVEPVTSTGKTDILLYCDDEYYDKINLHLFEEDVCYKKIQVKKRKDAVSQQQIKDWFKELKNDDAASKCEFCLFGKTTKQLNIQLEEGESVIIYNNDIDTVQSDIFEAIATYCDDLNAKDYSDDDLDIAYARLFRLLTINGMQAEPIKKTEINEVLHHILENSADNKAAMIKYTSERKFYSDNAHSRDLHPARLDAGGGMLIREDCSPKLLPDEFPEIKPVIDDMNSEEFPSNLFEYVEQHIADTTDSRHIYLSATSGSGKTTCLYGLWDKYLIDDTKYIPIYVAMHEVKGSLKKYICGEYLSQGTTISDFDWLKSPDFVKTQYHILLLLDGYNEIAVNMDPEIDETIKKEIKEILEFEHVSVVITSRDPINTFKASITNLKLCPLHPDQIKCLMGGQVEFLIEDRYEGILTNPFMLELCIKAFADDKNRLKSINEVSEEEIIREYLKKQIEGYK